MAKRKKPSTGQVQVDEKPAARASNAVVSGPEIRGEQLMEWSGNPWKTRWKKLAALLAIYVLMVAIANWIAPNEVFLIYLLPIMLVGSSAPHLFPSRYILTTEGIYWQNFVSKTFRPWIAFTQIGYYDDALELFYNPASVRNRILRGIIVYYDDNQDEVKAMVKRLWSEHQARVAGSKESTV
ncbi:MAG: hypothetical protein ACM3ZQ_10265 [Bacillota bacterium]